MSILFFGLLVTILAFFIGAALAVIIGIADTEEDNHEE